MGTGELYAGIAGFALFKSENGERTVPFCPILPMAIFHPGTFRTSSNARRTPAPPKGSTVAPTRAELGKALGARAGTFQKPSTISPFTKLGDDLCFHPLQLSINRLPGMPAPGESHRRHQFFEGFTRVETGQPGFSSVSHAAVAIAEAMAAAFTGLLVLTLGNQ